MRRSCRAGLHCSAWEHLQAPEAPPPEGAQVARLARLYMTTQTEPGHLCPLTMTHAAVPALPRKREIAALLLPKMLSRQYHQHFRPLGAGRTSVAEGKSGSVRVAPGGRRTHK